MLFKVSGKEVYYALHATHTPYRSAKFRLIGYYKPYLKDSSVLSGAARHRKIDKRIESVINVMGIFLSKLGVVESAGELRDKMRLPPISPMDVVRRNYGKNGLIDAYKENLRIVLDYVVKLCRKFPRKKIVITSDHGELPGEEGTYEHPNGPIDSLQQPFPREKENTSGSFMASNRRCNMH